MSIGLEHFRALGESGVNRIGGQANPAGQLTQVTQAPLSLFGKAVAWHNNGARTAAEGQENVQVRRAFVAALVKAYGGDVARAVMNRHGDGGFNSSTHALSGDTVKALIRSADRFATQHAAANRAGALQYAGNGLGARFAATVGQPPPAGLGVPAGRANDPAFTIAFRHAVSTHPDFAARSFTPADLDAIADNVANSHFRGQIARFDQTYGSLGQLANAPFHGTPEFFDGLRADLRNPAGPYNGEVPELRQAAALALTNLQSTSALLSRMPFDPQAVRAHENAIAAHLQTLTILQSELANTPQIQPATPAGQALQQAILGEIAGQMQSIADKATFCQEYRQNDPLSEKQLAYNQLLWAQGAVLMINDAIHDLGISDGNPLRTMLEGQRDAILNQATGLHQNASTDRRVNMKTVENDLKNQKIFVKAQIKNVLSQAAASGAAGPYKKGLEDAASRVDKEIDGARLKAMNTTQAWQTIRRDMVVSRDGHTRTYSSEIKPASESPGRTGRLYREAGTRGVSAGTKDDPENARNLQASRLTDSNNRVLHSSVRHGVLDPWELPSKDRQGAANRQASQVLHLAVEETAPRFRDALLNDAAQGPARAFRHLHVNFNLTTPVDRPGDYAEGAFTEHQFKAFENQNGNKVYTLDDPGVPGGRAPQQDRRMPLVDVDTITFSFGVNDLALAPGSAHGLKALTVPVQLGMSARAWDRVYDHDKRNLEKLFGDLSVGTRPGGKIGELLARMDNAQPPIGAPATWAADRDALKAQIREQVDISRELFNSDDFKKRQGDPYKMARHTMRVMDLAAQALDHIQDETYAMTQSQGCKSNKDRGGNGDVEIKAQAIIEDMGGHVTPKRAFAPEDQVIYNTVMTSSGQAEFQQFNTGLMGSKNAKELGARLADADATVYAGGLSKYTKA